MNALAGPALLFCPADRGDRYAKAAAAADAVILDLEDAVAHADKPGAREQLIAHAASEAMIDPTRTIVRVNPVDTDDHRLDLAALARTPYRAVMLAKTESAEHLDTLGEAGYRVIALCETVLGIERTSSIAQHEAVVALMWGAEDLAASLGGRSSRHADGRYRDFARYARSRVLFAARAAGRAAIDSVYLSIPDLDGLREEAFDAVESGFDAKAAIHPSQAAVIREGFGATPAQRAWAERVLAEAERQPGVFSFEGSMVDEPVLRQARAVLGR